MITYKFSAFIITFTLLVGCQTPFEFQNPDAEMNIPVVEGVLTNTDGPHSVRLSYAKPYNTSQNEYIDRADVWIGEVNGDSVRMEEMGKGYYQIGKGIFHPETGREYKLSINLPDGSVIRSEPSVMPDTIAIDEVYFLRNHSLNPADFTMDGSQPGPGVSVHMVLSNTNKGKVFYRVQGEYAYFVKQVQLKYETLFEFLPYGGKMPAATLESCIIDSCYSLFQYKDQHRIGQLNQDVQYDRSDLTFSVSLFKPSLSLAEMPKSVWEDLNWPSKYPTKSPVLKWINYARVYHLSAGAYHYYNAQLDQINAPQRIFDPVPYQIQSNLHFERETSRPVLGFFDVCAVNQRIYEVAVFITAPFGEPISFDFKAEVSNDAHYFLGCRRTQIDSISPFIIP